MGQNRGEMDSNGKTCNVCDHDHMPWIQAPSAYEYGFNDGIVAAGALLVKLAQQVASKVDQTAYTRHAECILLRAAAADVLGLMKDPR
jgi:hypothetical protein